MSAKKLPSVIQTASALIFVLALSQKAWSCAVCMGNTSSDMKKGFFWGILLLLLLPPAIITVITTKIVLSIRHKKSENI